jgi:hypothetical protein
VTYFLIALVVMVALSPLISMMPSRRQRQIANLRQRASLCGMSVQLRAKPGAADTEPLVAFYGRHRERGDRKGVASVRYQRDGDRWVCPEGVSSAVPQSLLQQFPVGVSHLIEDLHNIGVYWDEQGVEADVERINDLLKQLLKGSYLLGN